MQMSSSTLLWGQSYQGSCTEFLLKVEQGHIQAVTSDFVLNEVMYALLLGKGSEILASS